MKNAVKSITKSITKKRPNTTLQFSILQALRDIDSVKFSTNKLEDTRMKSYYKALVEEGSTRKRLVTYLDYNAKRLRNESKKVMSGKLAREPEKKAKSVGTMLVRLNPNDPNDHRLVSKKMPGQIREHLLRQYENYKTYDTEKEDIVALSYAEQARNFNAEYYYGFDTFEYISKRDIKVYNFSEGWFIDPDTGVKRYFDDVDGEELERIGISYEIAHK